VSFRLEINTFLVPSETHIKLKARTVSIICICWPIYLLDLKYFIPFFNQRSLKCNVCLCTVYGGRILRCIT
jgi:hypothetical protein